jgi:exodeoxyribonuclease VIII
MINVMVDLETLGNGSLAAIISIGAVEFDPETGELGREFYMLVDAQSAVDLGLEIDASTVMWWMKQDVAAKAAFKDNGETIRAALEVFANWYPEDAPVWGNGATFDNVILANAYRLARIERPWNYWEDRCYRTLKTLYPEVEQENVGVAHNALDDAKYQALHAIKLLARAHTPA